MEITAHRILPFKTECIIKGDSLSLSIAAASIIAKVTRDKLMLEAENRFPGYSFGTHKGYPTKVHLQKLALTRLITHSQEKLQTR